MSILNNLSVVIGLAFYIGEWLIRIGSLFVVPRNRKPSSATAWLMLIMLMPYVGLVIYLLIGSPKLPRRRRELQRDISSLIYKKIEELHHAKDANELMVTNIDERIKPFVLLNRNLSGFPIFDGNKIRILDEYDEILHSVARDVEKAKKFVHIEYYILAMDDATELLFKNMEAAVKRGVKVRLLFDAIGSRSYPQFKDMKKRLTDIGVEWHEMLPIKLPGKKFTRPDLRNHRKIVVIDGEIAYTGSLNYIDRHYHRKDKLYYDELVIRVEGPLVLQFHAVFITDWYSETETILNKNDYPEMNIDFKIAGNIAGQVLPSGPGYDDYNNLKLFTGLIHSARKKIVITNPYFVPDDSLMVAITSAAQRNVEVIMINSKIMDQNFVGNAQRSYYEELLKAGVKIYQYKWPVLLHSKHMTIDDEIAVIGSSNLDMRSFQLDLEVTLVAYDSGVVKGLRRVQAKNLKMSEQLTLKKWQNRSTLTKLKENMARLTAALQ